MKTLWAYGCSWTYSDIHENEYKMVFWPSIVAHQLKMEVMNRGWGGESIGLAAIKLMNDLSSIKQDDIMVFQFSYPDRLALPSICERLPFQYWSIHDVKYFKNKDSFFKEKRILTYLDFILLFRYELLMKEFYNLLPIFNFIEKNIGATVKYWFLNISRQEDDKEMLKFMEGKLWNNSRSIEFPPIPFQQKFFTHFIEAEPQMCKRGLRISDNQEKYTTPKTFIPRDDNHPDQNGQKFIAKSILLSIDSTLDLSDFDVIKRLI